MSGFKTSLRAISVIIMAFGLMLIAMMTITGPPQFNASAESKYITTTSPPAAASVSTFETLAVTVQLGLTKANSVILANGFVEIALYTLLLLTISVCLFGGTSTMGTLRRFLEVGAGVVRGQIKTARYQTALPYQARLSSSWS